jgi:hypothetical protein
VPCYRRRSRNRYRRALSPKTLHQTEFAGADEQRSHGLHRRVRARTHRRRRRAVGRTMWQSVHQCWLDPDQPCQSSAGELVEGVAPRTSTPASRQDGSSWHSPRPGSPTCQDTVTGALTTQTRRPRVHYTSGSNGLPDVPRIRTETWSPESTTPRVRACRPRMRGKPGTAGGRRRGQRFPADENSLTGGPRLTSIW